MEFLFKKNGKVKIDNGENEPVQLEDPNGKPKLIQFDFDSDELILTTRAWDELNDRTWPYPITLDGPAQQAIAAFFLQHVVRIAESQYPEFENLEPGDA